MNQDQTVPLSLSNRPGFCLFLARYIHLGLFDTQKSTGLIRYPRNRVDLIWERHVSPPFCVLHLHFSVEACNCSSLHCTILPMHRPRTFISSFPFPLRSFDLPGICVYSNVLFLCAPAEGFFQRAKNKPCPLHISTALSLFNGERVDRWRATSL